MGQKGSRFTLTISALPGSMCSDHFLVQWIDAICFKKKLPAHVQSYLVSCKMILLIAFPPHLDNFPLFPTSSKPHDLDIPCTVLEFQDNQFCISREQKEKKNFTEGS